MFERRPLGLTILLLATLGVLGWGCEKKEVAEEDKVLARVGDETITLKDFEDEINRMPPHMRRRMARVEQKKKQLERLIEGKLMLQEAEWQGLADDPTITAQVENYRSRLVAQKLLGSVKKGVSPVTEEDIKEHFEKNRAIYQTRKQIRARHILLKDEAEAKKVLKKAKAPGADFAALAKEYSQDRATKNKGGDLGYFSPGRMVRQFEDAAFSLEKPGEISDIVKSPFGYHIIKLEDKKAAEPKTLAQVKGEIRRKLTSERQNAAQEEFLEEIKSRTGVEVNEDLLSGEAKPEVKPKPPVEEEEPAEEPEEPAEEPEEPAEEPE
jgi:peptidyl-prolyl cis-trans isomerase C